MIGRTNVGGGSGSDFTAYIEVTSTPNTAITATNLASNTYTGTTNSSGALTLTVHYSGTYTVSDASSGTATVVVADDGVTYPVVVISWDGYIIKGGTDVDASPDGSVAALAVSYNSNYTAQAPTITRKSNYYGDDVFMFNCSSSTYAGSAYTSYLVDVNIWKTLKIEVVGLIGTNMSLVFLNENNNAVLNVGIGGGGTVYNAPTVLTPIDIGQLISQGALTAGSYKISVYVYNNQTMRITNMWVER